MNYELITEQELKAIDEIWDNELDLSRRVLVDLYYEVTGKYLPWDIYKQPLFDKDTIDLLEKLCKENNVPFELVRNMVLSVNKNKNYSNQKILRTELDKLLNQQWLYCEVFKEIENANN